VQKCSQTILLADTSQPLPVVIVEANADYSCIVTISICISTLTLGWPQAPADDWITSVRKKGRDARDRFCEWMENFVETRIEPDLD
jgi:hypothetical protein